MLEYNQLFNRVYRQNLFQTFSRTYTKQALASSLEKHYLKINQTIEAGKKNQNYQQIKLHAHQSNKKSKEDTLKQSRPLGQSSQTNPISHYSTINDGRRQIKYALQPNLHNQFLKKRLKIKIQTQFRGKKGFSIKQCGAKQPSYDKQFENDETDFSILALKKKNDIGRCKTMKTRLLNFTCSGKRSQKVRSISLWGHQTRIPKFDAILQQSMQRPWTVAPKTSSEATLINKRSERKQL